MAFRFSLQPLLRIRASYERLERLRLLAMASMVVRVRDQVADLDRQRASAAAIRQQRLRSGAAAIELQLDVASENLRARKRKELLERLSAFEKQQTKQKRVYQVARQKRQIVENLRDRRLGNYRREQQRKEQQAIDELHLLRGIVDSSD